MDFPSRKAATLASMGFTEHDKSPKGSLDAPIIPLLNILNDHPSFFTTSSCSGRISILSQPIAPITSKKKARGGSWLFVTHAPADPNSVTHLLFHSLFKDTPPSHLVFRFEPLIIAVECKDLVSAQSLVSFALSSGFRESGITSATKRVIIAIRCSIRLEVPLGTTENVMVSPDYVRFLIQVANEKMEANRKRCDRFLDALRRSDLGASKITQSYDGEAVLVVQTGSVSPSNDAEGRCQQIDEQDGNSKPGSFGPPSFVISINRMEITGEPIEKLFLWGHSSCASTTENQNKIVVFGGFGGPGRHARRSCVLLLDPLLCSLQEIKTEEGPSARLGHTSSLIGECIFVIGGRADPLKILGDLWVLDLNMNKWTQLQCTGDVFPPRHRHSAVVVGSNIYVFGGLYIDSVSSSMYVLDTDKPLWKELKVNGELPCARHSHSVVACGSLIFMFGGYNGEKALGDLYSFDVQTCHWKQVKTFGRSPHARFSHSMFVYNNFLGVMGGCPVIHNFHELALLDLRLRIWKHVSLDSVGKYLFVRSTATVVGDELVIIGGGASCYAFGTKFSEPVKFDLHSLVSCDENLENLESGVTQSSQNDDAESSIEDPDLNVRTEAFGLNKIDQHVTAHWVLQIERKHAKLVKDILKQFGWLDLGRKVHSREAGVFICFPVSNKFCDLFDESELGEEDSFEGNKNLQFLEPLNAKGFLSFEVSYSEALNILKRRGAKTFSAEVVEIRLATKSPAERMRESVASFIKQKGLSEVLLEELPTRWDRLGDVVVLPSTSFKDPTWKSSGEELWHIIAKSLNAHRLACQGRIAPNGTRDSTLEILVGDHGWVDHCENGIIYSFDATKCMFSWGNLSEKLRMGLQDCENETVVDLFAGIGYFVLPFLVRAKAKLVYACEWNPYALEALQRNLQANLVSDRCIVLEGDNRNTAPKGVADRVCLGLLPSSQESWVTAVRALRSDGGMLHIHGNVKDSEEREWSQRVLDSISEIAECEGHGWEVAIENVERVKWYAPRIRHLVADVRCRNRKLATSSAEGNMNR